MYPDRLTYTTCMSLFLLSRYNESGGEAWSSVSTDAVPGRAAAWSGSAMKGWAVACDGPSFCARLEQDMHLLT